MLRRALNPCPKCHGPMMKFVFGRYDTPRMLICQNKHCGFTIKHSERFAK